VRYANETLRERLAAEYVLGTLAPLARRRFQSLLRYHAALRRSVARWESDLAPLADALPERAPPEHVWKKLSTRIAAPGGRERAPGGLLAFWRGFALAAVVLLVAALGWLGVELRETQPPSMMAVLSDAKAQPALVVSWPKQTGERKHVKVRVLAQPAVPANASLQLWLIPKDDMSSPISAGLVQAAAEQLITMPAAASAVLGKAWGFAISVEPVNGSPTGRPTGPVIYQGPCVPVI